MSDQNQPNESRAESPSPAREKRGGGAFIALAIIGGTLLGGFAFREPSAGFIIGLIIGLLITLYLWLSDRNKGV